MIKRRLEIFWIALAIYAVSFFLFAVGFRAPGSRPVRGYWCAYAALTFPFRDGAAFGKEHFEHFSLLVSGLINVIFLLFVILVVAGTCGLLRTILRLAVPLMIPFCWVVFYYEGIYPREGHLLWIAAMLLVLLSRGPQVSGRVSVDLTSA